MAWDPEIGGTIVLEGGYGIDQFSDDVDPTWYLNMYSNRRYHWTAIADDLLNGPSVAVDYFRGASGHTEHFQTQGGGGGGGMQGDAGGFDALAPYVRHAASAGGGTTYADPPADVLCGYLGDRCNPANAVCGSVETGPLVFHAYDSRAPHGPTSFRLTLIVRVYDCDGHLLVPTPPASPPPPDHDVDVYQPDSTYLATILHKRDLAVRFEWDREGSWTCTINKNDDQATEEIWKRGNLVRITFEEIDPDAIFEGVIETGDFELLSSDEEGGEDLHFGGPGNLSVLAHAVMWDVETTGGGVHALPDEGVWRFSEAWNANHLIAKLLNEAQDRSPDPLLGTTRSWSALDGGDDSAAVAFPNVDFSDDDYEIPIGANVLEEILKIVADAEYRIEMRPGLVLDLFGSLGRDLTGDFGETSPGGYDAVRFKGGVNIASDLTRQMIGKVWGSDALIKTKTTYAHTSIARDPYRFEVYYDLSEIKGSATYLRRAARKLLRAQDAAEALLLGIAPYGQSRTPNDPANGWYYPGPPDSANGKYWLGDLITLDTGAGDFDYDATTQRIQAITLQEDETGALDIPLVELNAPFVRPEGTGDLGSSTGVSSLSSTSSGVSSPTGGAGTTDHGHLSGLADDDHTQYQKESEKGAASGYAELDAGSHVPQAQLGSGSGGAGAKVLYDDQTYKTPAAGVTDHGALTGLADDDHPQYTTDAEATTIADTEAAAAVATHTGDATDAHDASAISIVDSGSYFTGIEVEAALQELGASRAAPVDVGLEFVIDGGGAVVTTGDKGGVEIPFGATIRAARLFADVSGSVVVDVRKTTYSAFDPPTHPASGDSITASAKPTISSAKKSQDTTLTGWTTAISAGDFLQFNVDSVATIGRVTVSLTLRRT